MGAAEEVEGEEDNVCGGLAEPEHVGIAVVYDPCVGARRQDQLRQERISLCAHFPGKPFSPFSFYIIKNEKENMYSFHCMMAVSFSCLLSCFYQHFFYFSIVFVSAFELLFWSSELLFVMALQHDFFWSYFYGPSESENISISKLIPSAVWCSLNRSRGLSF